MLRIREITAPLDFDGKFMVRSAAKKLGVPESDVTEVRLKKRATDARKKTAVTFKLTVDVCVRNEEKVLARLKNDPNVSPARDEKYVFPEAREFDAPPVVVGLGPAGLFAAYVMAKCGARPVVLERGGDVDTRRKKVEQFWKSGTLDTECNVQFGEGGAGTFSDGKLTTGTKDERIPFVFETLVSCGAPEDILYLAKPHVGTDRLGETVKELRRRIVDFGGTVIFGAKLVSVETENGMVKAAVYEKNGQQQRIETKNIILAPGHSARDTFEMLRETGAKLSRKTFAVGVRIEHRRDMIEKSLYGEFARKYDLGGDYKLAVHLPGGRSVYTFCMCPGGRVVAAASESGGVVTNGMSNYLRNGENSNSALLVNVFPEDLKGDDPLEGVEFQRRLERRAFNSGGGDYCAPVTLVGDFLRGEKTEKFSSVFPSYLPGVRFARPEDYLPQFVCDALREGIRTMGRKISGFDSEDAVLTGVESRSSSPVRIERGEDMQSVSIDGLYPCGEGAGYAGGIVSAAVDGIRCAEAVLRNGK